ncbi:MAG: dolichyl-phosphate beta-glucosyltransferase [bacterium]
MKLSVIIPAYNEAERIKKTILSLKEYLDKQDYSWEIIVISDGSKDNTAEAAKQEAVKVIDNKTNQGKGAVVKQAMLEANGDYRLFMDADNSTKINNLDKFWQFFEQGYDVVVASIALKESKIVEKTGWHRRMLGKFAKYLIQVVMCWRIKDSQRGFKCFTKKAALKIFPKQKIMRWGFDIEILALARLFNYKIKEVPIAWQNIGKSEVNLKSYLKTLLELLKIKWNLITNQYQN